MLREFVTVHRPIEPGGETRIGAGCLLMVGAHVAHDCRVGDRVVLTNAAQLGGHVEVGDDAVIGGLAGVHQFVRIGRGAMVAAHAMVRKDILPFSLAAGQPARHQRLNTVGLRRRGVPAAARRALEAAFRACRAGRRPEADGTVPEVAALLAFLSAPSRRGLAGFARPGARVQAD
ncbi:MAG: hypothetical protein KatS3mg121_1528 [Gammaproteobacteria bacterium]|nr:MAG: hypothetical protein KatS3mg121_1528 [Gammaproteobacteria bacterium]